MLALALAACAGGSEAPPAPVPEPAASEEAASEEAAVSEEARMEARLRVDAEPGGKRFQGVWLEREGEEPLIAAYRALSCFAPFDGHRVRVTGERWSPDPRAQQIAAPHFRIATLELADPAAASDVLLHAVGAEQELVGVARTEAGEPGSKEEGATWTVFVAGGTTWRIWDAPEDLPIDTPLAVTGREVTVSPFAAHAPGRHLWIGGFARV